MSTLSSEKHYDSAAAYVFAQNQQGEPCILTLQRGAYNNIGKRTVPMGMSEPFDDNPFATAKRECQEETGISIEGCKEIDGGDEPWGNGKIGKNCIFVYNKPINTIFSGDGENEDIQWTPLKYLSNYQWGWHMDRTIMDLYRRI